MEEALTVLEEGRGYSFHGPDTLPITVTFAFVKGSQKIQVFVCRESVVDVILQLHCYDESHQPFACLLFVPEGHFQGPPYSQNGLRRDVP
ncbi:hypothetical protein WG66_012881 [Moniliophthora roreri]|uniref:Uncharacterized protein n=1 Tax=Moniliophthora roreri TaxID=221103 RepID=A0A0W0FG59_MONRR|nr:hypothetical protein WG66_012881 [Moniliophthora roreri]